MCLSVTYQKMKNQNMRQSSKSGRDSSQSVQGEKGVETSLDDIRAVIVSNRWIVAGVTLFITLSAALYAFFAQPVYLTGALVRFEGKEGDRALFMLHSRTFLEEIIRKEELLPLLFSDQWDAVHHSWASGKGEIPDPEKGAVVLAEKLIIKKRKDLFNLLFIGMEHPDPYAAADLINRVLIGLNEYVRKEALAKALLLQAYAERQLFVHDSTLADRFASLGEADAVRLSGKNGDREAESEVSGFLRSQLILSSSLETRARLMAKKQESDDVIMRADIHADEFALKIYDMATAYEKTAKPGKSAVIVLGFIFGMFSGLCIAFVRGLK